MASKYESRRIWMNTGASAKLKNIALEEATVRRTQRIYREAQKDIEAQVAQVYAQLGTLSKTNRWEFPGMKDPAKRKDISALVKAIDKAGLTDYVPEKLTKRMSVLQVKQMNIWLRIHQAGQDSHATTKEALLKTMQNSGKAWASALAAGADSFVGFDRNICGYMMGMNWADGNFSSRLWQASDATWEQVRDELTRAMANGQQPETTNAHLRRILTEAHNKEDRSSGGLSYDVERIVRTETAKAATQADLARWREAGVDKVQWHASFEKNTCSHCADRDGRIYALKEAMLDEPPLHPNCRCYFTAYDEVAAKVKDTTYYKDKNGEYKEIQWAPYRSLIDEKGELRTSPLQVSDYFWKLSPWTTYTAPKTGITYKGEIDKQVLDMTERTIKAAVDQYPEIGDRLASTFKNEVTMHRGSSTVIGNSLDHIGGLTDPAFNQLTVSYLDKAVGGNPLTQMARQAREQFKQGYWSSPKDNHAIMHELGHVLAVDLKQKRGVDIEQLVLDATSKRTWKSAQRAIKSEISRYGAKNPEEAFAEIFARMATQDPSLQTQITARFANAVENARKKPVKKIKIKVTEMNKLAQVTPAEAPAIRTTGKETSAFINELDEMSDGKFTKDIKGVLAEMRELGVDTGKIQLSTEMGELTPGERKLVGDSPDLLGKALVKKNMETKIYLDGDDLADRYSIGLTSSKYDAARPRQAQFTDGSAIGTIRHELGHLAAENLMYKNVKETGAYINAFDANKRYQKLLEKVMGKGTRAADLKLSEYGKVSAGEAIAESIANPNFSSDTRKIYDYIKSHAKKIAP